MSVTGVAVFTPGTQTPQFDVPVLAGGFTGPASYTNPGGESQDFATDHGLPTAPTIVFGYCFAFGADYCGYWDAGTSTWKFLVRSTGIEVANATNLSAVNFLYFALRSM